MTSIDIYFYLSSRAQFDLESHYVSLMSEPSVHWAVVQETCDLSDKLTVSWRYDAVGNKWKADHLKSVLDKESESYTLTQDHICNFCNVFVCLFFACFFFCFLWVWFFWRCVANFVDQHLLAVQFDHFLCFSMKRNRLYNLKRLTRFSPVSLRWIAVCWAENRCFCSQFCKCKR